MRILVKSISVAIISISLYALQEKRCAIDIGSGAMKVQMALFDTEKNEMLKLLDEPFYIDIPLANYYAQDGDLSEAIQHKAIKAFNTILERCAEKQITKMAGIATAIFRKADKNGPLLFNALKELAQKKFGQNNVNLQIVSQELEGKLGFLTAAGLSPEFESSDIVAWDCGNSSFQLVLQEKKNLLIYEGPFGVANCAQLFIELIRKENYKAGIAINPVTIDELTYFIDHLYNMIEIPTDFIEKIHTPNKEIIGIGRRSIFALAAESLNKKSFSPEEVHEVILNLAKLKPDDSALASLDDEEPETVLLRLILLYVVMRKISAKEVRYKESTGTALGIFLTTEFW